jgi:dimethylargininase
MPGAITRAVNTGIARCELTHLTRQPIDVDAVRRQHDAYEQELQAAGYVVTRLAADGDIPDSVFIEDIAVVFDRLAIVTRPGAVSRRAESAAVADALRPLRPLHTIDPPGTIDGGDVLTIGRRVFIGESRRTNAAAIAQMRAILAPHGYTVTAVAVRGCLHLKSAVTAIADDLVLINRDWVPPEPFLPCRWLDVDAAEPTAANALRLRDSVLYPLTCPRTRERIEQRGISVVDIDVSEIAKAEGAVTCCSVIVA